MDKIMVMFVSDSNIKQVVEGLVNKVNELIDKVNELEARNK